MVKPYSTTDMVKNYGTTDMVNSNQLRVLPFVFTTIIRLAKFVCSA